MGIGTPPQQTMEHVMGDEQNKFKNSKRRLRDDSAVKKQVKIAKQHGFTETDIAIQEPHRMNKHHAMDCGQSGCTICGNPRKVLKQRTQQEKRIFQDLDQIRDRHNNGFPPENE